MIDVLKLICSVSALGKANKVIPIYYYDKVHSGCDVGFILVTEIGCICPGQTMTLECNVIGSGSTVLIFYHGSSIICNRREIVLLHNRYDTGGTTGKILCNNATIELVGRSLSVENNNCFTSQFQIKFNNIFVENFISCVYDNGRATKLVGNFSTPSFGTIGNTYYITI